MHVRARVCVCVCVHVCVCVCVCAVCIVQALYLVVVYDFLRLSPVKHLLVPFNQPLWFWYLLLFRVTVENVVISLAGGTGPDVSHCKPRERGEESVGVRFHIRE